nr:uncharacterized protein LOC112741563 isoform X2 [Arachis hypogaea]
MEVELMVLKLLLLNLMRRLIPIGHGFVVGDEGYRQDCDIQKVKLSREALTQLSKLVESRVSTGLDTILTLFYSFWNWGCCQLLFTPILNGKALLYSVVSTLEVRIGIAFGSGGSQSLPATEWPSVSSCLEKLFTDTLVKTMVEEAFYFAC